MKIRYTKLFAKIAFTLTLATPFAISWADVDMNLISKDALIKAPETVDCTLENGIETQCVKFVVKYQPDNLKTGPFCPETLDEKGGIWSWDGDKKGLYRIDKEFLTMLDGQGYKFYDADGKVYITDLRKSQPASANTCLMVSLDKTVEMTILLPVTPTKAEKATNLGTVAKIGLALDGVPIFADAPSVLQTGHMPALDTCGGHVDPGGWYHWHATSTDINNVYTKEQVDAKCALEQKADALFAYAFDGFPIYGSVDKDGKVPTDLDACNGHTSPTPGSSNDSNDSYHYHASLTFPNLPTCLSGVSVKNNFTTNAKQGIGAKGAGGPDHQRGGNTKGGPPGFEAAAKKLGVSQEDLVSVVMKNGGPNLNLTATAKALGVTEEALKAALPTPPGK